MPENATLRHPSRPHPLNPARRVLCGAALLALLVGGAPAIYAGPAASAKGPIRVETDAVTTTIAIPDALRESILRGAKITAELHLAGVRLPAERAAVVHVFGNLPRANSATSTDDPHFLGYFTLVPSVVSGGGKESATDVVLDVTPNLKRLVQEGRELAVTLVPVAAEGKKPARGLGLAVERIYLEQPGR